MTTHDFEPPTAADPQLGPHAAHCRRCGLLVVGSDAQPTGGHTEQMRDGKPMITVSIEQSRNLSTAELPPCDAPPLAQAQMGEHGAP